MILMNGGPNQYALFDNQNPYIPGSDQGFHMGTLPAIFEPLIMYNVLTGEHENWLAESWEYDDTRTVLTARLRRGIEWADGMPFTARDVAFTFEMLRDHAESMVHLADLPEFFDSAEVVDDHTVRFHLNQPGPAFWATTLSSNHGIQVLPEHVWRHEDPLEFTFHDIDAGLPLGTGPYRLVYASPYQKIYDLRRDWWAAREGFKPLPKIERIIYVPQQEESQSAQLLLTDQLDMAPIMQVLTLESVLERNPRVVTFSGREPPYGYLDWCPIDLNMNCSEPPYDDPEIRRAISMAIDRDKVVQLAESGAGVVALHPFTPYEWFAPFDEAPAGDPRAARVRQPPPPGRGGAHHGGQGLRQGRGGVLDRRGWGAGRDRHVRAPVAALLRSAVDPAAARRRLRRQLRHLAGPDLPRADGRADGLFGMQGAQRRARHGPLPDALLLHLAVLPAHRASRRPCGGRSRGGATRSSTASSSASGRCGWETRSCWSCSPRPWRSGCARCPTSSWRS